MVRLKQLPGGLDLKYISRLSPEQGIPVEFSKLILRMLDSYQIQEKCLKNLQWLVLRILEAAQQENFGNLLFEVSS